MPTRNGTQAHEVEQIAAAIDVTRPYCAVQRSITNAIKSSLYIGEHERTVRQHTPQLRFRAQLIEEALEIELG